MSRKIELPDSVYEALREAAESQGVTPAGWISAHLPRPGIDARTGKESGPSPGTLAERFAGRVGYIASGGRGRLSEAGGRKFADHLEAKRRAGHL